MNKCLLFLLPLLLLSLPVAALQTVNFTIIDDSYIVEHKPTTNYGGAQNVWISAANNTTFTSGDEFGYWMVNLSLLPSTAIVSSATFHVRQQTSSSSYGTHYMLLYNTTNNWQQNNITWAVRPTQSVLQSNFSHVHTSGTEWWSMNVTDAVQTAVTKNLSLMLRYDENNLSSKPEVAFYNASYNLPYLEVTFTQSNNDCNTVRLGSFCNAEEIAAQGYATSINTYKDYTCQNDETFLCPENTRCSQIAYAENITNTITDITDCSQCILVAIPAATVFDPEHKIIFSPNCKYVSQEYINSCYCGSWWCSGNIYNNSLNNSYTIDQWVAGCWDSVSQKYVDVINSTGQNTSIGSLNNQYCPGCTPINVAPNNTCQLKNTSTSCYDAFCNSVRCTSGSGSGIQSDNYADQIALGLGSTMGITDLETSRTMTSLLLTMLGAAGVLILFATMKIHGQILGQSFLISLLMFLVLFTIVGWFPSWLMVILMVISGLMIAKTLKVF